MKSPTSRSLDFLRKNGWTAEVVEKWIPGVNVRKDLFGFIDIVAVRPGETLGVQATSYGNVSSRVRKISDSENVGAVREAGWSIHVHGWRKSGRRWECRVVDMS